MKYNNIIIDGNNAYWRAWFNNTSECIINNSTIYNGGIALFVERLKSIRQTYGYTESLIYILFDNPESTVKMRKEIDEEYKSHRLNNRYSEEINKSIYYLREVLRNSFDNTYVCYIDGCEADDIVPLVLDLCKDSALLISADLDWARSISETVSWFSYKKIYTLEEFKKEFGFYPNDNKLKLYKSFKGDDSDNIPNAVPYLPKETLIHIIDSYYDIPIEKLIPCLMSDNILSVKWKKDIKSAENRIKRNYNLVDFCNIDEDIHDHLQKCSRNKTLCRVWCKITDIDIPTWAVDTNKPDDFLTVKTFRKGKK